MPHTPNRMWARLFTTSVVMMALTATALATKKGPDAGNYKATDQTAFSFIDVAASGGASILTDTDDAATVLTLPFTFQFYGTSYTRVCVSSNGAAYFVVNLPECGVIPDFANTDLSSTSVPNDKPAILPYWTDLVMVGPNAGVVYQSQGAPGSRKFIIQWNNAYVQSDTAGLSAAPVTFQAILHEGSNQILFQYKTVELGPGNFASNGVRATIGIRNTGGVNNGQQLPWSYNSAVLADSTAILFSSGKATPTVSVTGGSFPYNGSPRPGSGAAYGAGGLSELLSPPVTFSYTGTGTTSYTSNAAPTDAGTYDVTANFAGNTDYASGSATTALTITTVNQVVAFTSVAPGNAVVGGPAYVVAATGGGSGNPVLFSSQTTGVCAVAGTNVTFAAVGDCIVQADQAGTNNYNAAPSVQQTFSVGKGTQSPVFVMGPITVAVGVPGTASAIGGDGTGDYIFSHGASTGCQVSGTTVTLTDGSGTCDLTATRAGDANYHASAPSPAFHILLERQAQSALNVTGPVSVTFGTPGTATALGGDGSGALTFSAEGSTGCSIAGSMVSVTNALGTCVLTATKAGDATYASTTSGPFTVTLEGQSQTPLSVTGPGSVTFGTPGMATFTGGDGNGALTFSKGGSTGCSVVGTTVSVSDVSGTCVLTASKAGDATFAPATSDPFTVTLQQASQEITFTSTPPASPTVGGPTYIVSATGGASGKPVTFSSLTAGTCSVSASSVSFAGAGLCEIAANQAGNNNYAAAAQVTQTMTVVAGSGTATTTTTVVSSVNPSTINQSVTFTATVRRTDNNDVVTTGKVQFKDGGKNLAPPVNVNASGQATFTTTSLDLGVHSITAAYTDGLSFTPSSGVVSQTVTKIPTETTFLSLPAQSEYGDELVLTAWVHRNDANVSPGSVTFRDGATILAKVGVNGEGRAVYKTRVLAIGSHQLTATYSGTPTYDVSSGSGTVLVIPASTQTSLESSKNPARKNDDITFTATVEHDGDAVKVGTVTFSENGTILAGPIEVDDHGHAKFKTRLAEGTHVITATYNGTATTSTSSTTLTQTIKK